MDDVLKQFYLDIKRLELYINGKKRDVYTEEDAKYVEKFICNNFQNSDFIIYSLTQTFLADFYIEEYNKISNDYHQLLDDGHGSHIVNIDSDKQLIFISKNFKITHIYEDKTYIIDYCTLNIWINSNIFYLWTYDFDYDKIEDDFLLLKAYSANIYLF